MHKQLIGQEASLTLPCTVDAAALLLGFVEELMEVSGSETGEPERLEVDLRQAVAAICQADDGTGSVQLAATFEIQDRSVGVRLTCVDHEARDLGVAEQFVVAHEA